jgi:type IX secretion system PorP/SprF family membrane protein
MKTFPDMKKILLFSFCFALFSFQLKAQDPHFTQFSDAPMLVNPANTGFYKGMSRFTANFRNQWDYRFINNNNIGATNTGYTTFCGSFDMSIKPNKKVNDRMLGIGVQLLADRAGEVTLSRIFGQFNMAYWKKLSYEKNRWISAGFSLGFNQMRVDYTNLQLPDQYNPSDPFQPYAVTSLPVNNNFIYLDLGMGVKYFASLGKKSMVNIGFAVAHLNQPKNSFLFNLPSDLLYRKYTFHAGMRNTIARKLQLSPTVLVMRQGSWFEMDEGAYLRFLLTEQKSKELMAFNIGVWARQANGSQHFVADAINPAMKMEFDQYTMGISYDINISKLTTTTHLKGGVELSFSYQQASDATLGNKRKPVCPVF